MPYMRIFKVLPMICLLFEISVKGNKNRRSAKEETGLKQQEEKERSQQIHSLYIHFCIADRLPTDQATECSGLTLDETAVANSFYCSNVKGIGFLTKLLGMYNPYKIRESVI